MVFATLKLPLMLPLYLETQMIHLIGVDHIVQHEGFIDADKRVLISEFQSVVRKVCATKSIKVLAEEFNREFCKINHVNSSVLENIASGLDLIHCFIEADFVERAERNVASEDHDLRESIWLEKLSPYINSEMIVVCGQKHIKSFSAKLRTQNVPFNIVKEELGVGYNPLREFFE